MKTNQIIELAEDIAIMKRTRSSHVFIGWGCVILSVVFLVIGLSKGDADFPPLIFLFLFGLLNLYLAKESKKELKKLNEELEKLK